MKRMDLQQARAEHESRFDALPPTSLDGPRCVLSYGKAGYPDSLMSIKDPPQSLYVVGNARVLEGGLAVIGARKATPYGRAAARLFAGIAAEKGITVVSGGALGCDTYAHEAALEAGGPTVAVLGGGCNQLYPARNAALFQRIVDEGGAVVSEQQWDFPPLPYTFRARNRIIAGLSRATLIVEAGLPSGTFSTADDALDSNRDVLVVPGAITSPTSMGANRLIYQGATPVIDRETFEDVLFGLFGSLRTQSAVAEEEDVEPLLAALRAEPLRLDQMLGRGLIEAPAHAESSALSVALAEYERDGLIERFPDGRYGPKLIW